MTLEQIRADHKAAMVDYADKVAAFRKSFVRLAAFDRLMANTHVAGSHKPSFAHIPRPIDLRHPYAAPDLSGDFHDDIRAQFETMLAEFNRSKSRSE